MGNHQFAIAQDLFRQLAINLEDVPIEYLADYTAITYFLTLEEAPLETASPGDKVRRFLESFYHFCRVEDWDRGLKVLTIEPEPKMDEELHHILGLWGYYQQQAQIYEALLYKVNDHCDEACLNGLGNLQEAQGNYPLAREYHVLHLGLAQRLGDRAGEWMALTGLGNVQQVLGGYEEAMLYFEQALAIAQEIGDIKGEVITRGSLASVCQGLGRWEQARGYAEGCLGLAQAHRFYIFEARSALILGNLSKDQEDLEGALAWYQVALDISEGLADQAVIIDALRGIGDVYEALGEGETALLWLLRALEMAQGFGEQAIAAEVWRALGNVYAGLGDLEQAIVFLERRLGFLELIGDRVSLASNLEGLSLLYDRLGRWAEAVSFEEKRLVILQELGDQEGAAGSYAYLGYAYLNLRCYQDALVSLMAALDLQRRRGDRRSEGNTLYNLAELMASLDQVSPAIAFCREGLAMAEGCDLDLAEAFRELLGVLEG